MKGSSVIGVPMLIGGILATIFLVPLASIPEGQYFDVQLGTSVAVALLGLVLCFPSCLSWLLSHSAESQDESSPYPDVHTCPRCGCKVPDVYRTCRRCGANQDSK